jgi:hypothetical protein
MIRKTFKDCLLESIKDYDLTIRIVGEHDKEFIDALIGKLKNDYGLVKMAEPKTLPITPTVDGFPDVKNEAVTNLAVTLRYPMDDRMIKDEARLLGFNENLISVFTWDYAENAYKEVLKAQERAIQGDDYVDPDAIKANEEYGDQYLKAIAETWAPTTPRAEKLKNDNDTVGNIPESSDPFKRVKPEASFSPLSKINREPKPATGGTK